MYLTRFPNFLLKLIAATHAYTHISFRFIENHIILVVDDVYDDFLEGIDDSVSSGGSAYTDTKSESETGADTQSDDEQMEADDEVQHNWQSQSAVDRSSFTFTGDSGEKLVLEYDQSPLEKL